MTSCRRAALVPPEASYATKFGKHFRPQSPVSLKTRLGSINLGPYGGVFSSGRNDELIVLLAILA